MDNFENQREYYFTSESVTEGHPDKVCDCISDGVLDSILSLDPDARVACETMASAKKIILSGEISTKLNLDKDFYIDVVRKSLNEIGYSSNSAGMIGDKVDVEVNIVKQSPDIARGLNQKNKKNQGAGDQGLMFGFACKETEQLMPLPIQMSHQLAEKLTEVRKSKTLDFLQPDGKTQVTIKYNGYTPIEISKIVIATQHNNLLKKFSNSETKEQDFIRESLIKEVINPILDKYQIDFNDNIIVNGTGRFVKGGPGADTGLTGRKIIVDTYGGYARHGGGAFSGKDPSKVDRSAAYMARYVSRQVVMSGLAERCELQLAYSIGVAEPVSILIDTFGTGQIDDDKITDIVCNHFDFKPFSIIKDLKLKQPIYRKLAAYGHLGRKGLPWETDKLKDSFLKSVKENLLWKTV